jgi:hypothetical protein
MVETTSVAIGAGSTAGLVAAGAGAYVFREPIIDAGKMVFDFAMDNKGPVFVGTLVAIPIVTKVGGFTTTDKWDSEAPYTPQPTPNQSNALVARTAARVSIVADKATVKNNEKRMAEIEDLIITKELDGSEYTMRMQEKSRLMDENIRLEAKIAENERAIRTHNSTIHPWRDNISDWYVKNGPLTTETRAMASSALFFGAGAYLVYNLVGDKKKFPYKGRSKRRPATAFGFTA